MVDGRDNAWRSRAPGPHAHGNTVRQMAACGQRRVDSKNSQKTLATTSTTTIRQLLGATEAHTAHTPCHNQHSPSTPTTGLRERGNDTSKSTGRNGQQKAAT